MQFPESEVVDEVDGLEGKRCVRLPPLNSGGGGRGGSAGAGQPGALSEGHAGVGGAGGPGTQKETFLTDVQVRLANLEIENPDGTCNTELEDASNNYKVVSEELRKQQHAYQEAMASLQAKRREVELKEVELLHRRQELDAFRTRQAHKNALLASDTAAQQAAIHAQVHHIADLIDEIKGATTLLQVMKQRTQECNKYKNFVFEVYERLNQGAVYQAQQQRKQYEVSSLERLQEAISSQNDYLKSVANQFTRLVKQEEKQGALEEALSARQKELLRRTQDRQEKNRVVSAQLEQQIAALNKDFEQLNIKFSGYEQNTKINNLKLDQKVQEMSNVQSSIKNLCRRIKRLLEERQRTLAARASILDVLGGRPNLRLETQVDNYYVRTNKILPRNECYDRVLGHKFLKRMRKIYRLGIFLKDLRDLEQICHDYRNGKGKVTIV